MRIIFETDADKEVSNSTVTSLNETVDTSSSANWRYAIATSVLILAMVLPQVSGWVESQLLVKSFQGLVLPRTIGSNKVLNTGRIAFPTAAGTPVTSEFGWRTHPITGDRKFHAGIDFGAAKGTPIYAIDAGRVVFAGDKGGYGKAAVIQHQRGLSTLYGHASQMYVQQGQQVVRGQMIAAVGSTGFSTGPHLHFEVRSHGVAQNPRPYLHEYLANR
ncbi:MAG: M23 family metallopeptidase [Nostoc sp. DedVER02]|uniref:M23 family metallopeptidase n=1 Tax=unclassified Nostoc TaxID=2593658 RepID=UPI002AD29A24|nr:MULTISPECIES: M23 family metallopeptidase [unclassified Nostoc]MDZ7989676.1 M23 family metallopeptidase [Nostoc sp. DedVER02]MDZ8113412.1 M23 family metallopeptidase [Nostoc sp. DedVER01b]